MQHDSSENDRSHNSRGELLYRQGRHSEALFCFMDAIKNDPEDAGAYFNVGKTLEAMGRTHDAVRCYVHSLALRPSSVVAHENLVQALVQMRRTAEAQGVIHQWLEREPGSPTAMHLLASLSGATSQRASEGYVRDLFDRYAAEFDESAGRLEYRGPELIASVLVEACGAPQRELDILDAGCGTGLCGGVLRPYARRLVGADLSPRMLERARMTGYYDELVESDLVAFMHDRAGAHHVVVAGDALCYFGDLEPVFAGVAMALKRGGLVAFTLEKLERELPGPGYVLETTGRFRHRAEYVARVAEGLGYADVTVAPCDLRREAAATVPGLVVTMRSGARIVASR